MIVRMRDQFRRRLGRIVLPADARPTRARLEDSDREVFLHWDGAVDDAGKLRRCLACSCQDLFQERAFPQVTAFVVVLAFAGAVISILGLATPPILIAMCIVLVLDLAIFLFSKRRLVCYRCRTSYRATPIARYHRSWDRTVAEKYPPPGPPPADAPEDGVPAAESANAARIS